LDSKISEQSPAVTAVQADNFACAAVFLSFIHSFIIKSPQQTCVQDYDKAVGRKHVRMYKNTNNDK